MTKKRLPFAKITLITGTVLMIMSYIAFSTGIDGFIREVHSEVFGVGMGIFVLGLVFLIFGRKIN